eukprot:CAMPEP_0113691782 /NCGR_PEP_ID=MMETSP0038_2-20120614/18677_1 /TAXON_ID=2898 /ORGANISM="Cryptomonas paramecium" /LENGTH=279 /DNA_ID=CAMNT_0000613535 /DNA_START=30 /DNA_END=866 /DNA_ORIENTATION=+ /assembly_acc=CAM_ASM_000170
MKIFSVVIKENSGNPKCLRVRKTSFLVSLAAVLVALYSFFFLELSHHYIQDDGTINFRHSRPSARTTKSKKLWIETISTHPRIFIIHNLITLQECEHLINLGFQKGLEPALITPYGTHTLVESSTRTNKQAWLEFGQDSVVTRIEKTLAEITNTDPVNGENLQILHYNQSQQFLKHHDYFDPATDPPQNFAKGGNRLATAVIYLKAAEQGGETDFVRLGFKLAAAPGDALLFYNLHPRCDGTRPECVDPATEHAGLPPLAGDKWVATKWIHERAYQGAP